MKDGRWHMPEVFYMLSIKKTTKICVFTSQCKRHTPVGHWDEVQKKGAPHLAHFQRCHWSRPAFCLSCRPMALWHTSAPTLLMVWRPVSWEAGCRRAVCSGRWLELGEGHLGSMTQSSGGVLMEELAPLQKHTKTFKWQKGRKTLRESIPWYFTFLGVYKGF